MGAIAIGPLIFAPHYFVAVLAAALFIASSWFLALTVDDKLYRVTMRSLASFVVAARIGHVLQYLPNFLSDPLRVFAFWQGGFYWPAGLFGLIVVNFIYQRNTGLFRGRQCRWRPPSPFSPHIPPTSLPVYTETVAALRQITSRTAVSRKLVPTLPSQTTDDSRIRPPIMQLNSLLSIRARTSRSSRGF